MQDACPVHKIPPSTDARELTKLDSCLRSKFNQHQTRSSARSTPFSLSSSIQTVGSISILKENLNAIALIATFLAAVQIQAISLTIQNSKTLLQRAINGFFFAGMFLDVLGGCIAFLAVVQLQKLYTPLARRTESASAILDALEKHISRPTSDCPVCDNMSLLRHHYQFMEVLLQRVLGDLRSWESEITSLQEFATLASEILHDLDKNLHSVVHPHLVEYARVGSELQALRLGMSIAYAASIAVPVIVTTGVVCFIIGGLCLVESGQPVGVWVPSFIVVFATLLSFGVMVRSG